MQLYGFVRSLNFSGILPYGYAWSQEKSDPRPRGTGPRQGTLFSVGDRAGPGWLLTGREG